MLGYPIHPLIQKTLNERKQVLKRNKNPYKLTKGKNPSKEIQKNIVRTPYISMLSSPKLISPTGDLDNSNFPTSDDIILSNQEYSRAKEEVNFSPINYGFELYSDVQKQGGKYKYQPDKNSDGTQRYQSQFKAQPGVISLTSEYQSTSNVYFMRNVSINWRCHHLDDLERLSTRFLTLNRLVYVEWGWNYADKPATTFITPANLKRISNPKLLREEVIKAGEGNFDAVLGYVSNFEWSSTGGGFECRTDIVSQGSDILSQRIGDDIGTIKEDKKNPNLTDVIIDTETIETVKRKGNALFSTLVKETETKNIVAQKGKTFIEKNADGSINIETERGLRFTESFKFAINNLQHTVSDLLSSASSQDISETTLYRNIEETEQKFDEAIQENKEEFADLLEQVREEYDNDDWSNWPDGIRGGGLRRINVTRREARRRFKEQNDGRGRAAARRFEKRKLKNAYKTDSVRPRNQTTTSQIFSDKNLIQKQVTTTNVLQKGAVAGRTRGRFVKRTPAANEWFKRYRDETTTNPEDTWVRWGWFEDNILSKFFGLVTQKGDTILQIRSIRNVLKTEEIPDKGPNGEEIKTNSKGQNYYIEKESGNAVIVVEPNKQERIKSHPNFKTEDINRFIFPGKFSLGITTNNEGLVTSERFETRKNDLLEQKYEERTLLGMHTENPREKSAAKLFLQRDPDTDEIINGQILIDPNISEQELDKILASKGVEDALSTGGRDPLLIKNISIEELKKEAESYRFLQVLEDVVNKNPIVPFDDPENKYRGILRNVFINVKHLQEMFKNVTTLGSALNLLLESFNTSAPIFKLVPIVNTADNEGQILFTNIDFLPDFIPETENIYSFPIKTTESFVKSTNLQSDITSEGAKILLSKRYAKQLVDSGNNVSVGNDIDKKTGANPTAQVVFDGMSSAERVAGELKFNQEGIPPYQFSQLNDGSQFGQKDGDFTKELTMQDGIDFGVFSVEAQDKITKNIDNQNQDEKTTETDIKFSIEFPGNYTPLGQLKGALKEQNAEKTEESGFKKASPYDELGLLFLTNTMSMDGIAGIFPGNIYTSNYLPDKFRNESYFFIQNASQTIDASTWTTEITGRVLFKYKKKSGNLGIDDIAEVNQSSES